MLLLQMDVGTVDSIGPLISAFFDKFESIATAAERWLTVGKIIGLIGAYVYIFKKFGSKIMTGETFNLSDIAYPIFIAFLLSVYSPVAKGIEKLFTSTYDATYISTTVSQIYSSVSKNKKNNAPINEEKKLEADASINISDKTLSDAEEYMKKDNSTEDVSIVSKATDLLVNGYESIVNGINSVILTVLTTILECVIVACIAIIFFLAKLYITFLYIFGPFSIGMSLIPGFENSITNWFQKYIGYSLWMPVAATIADLTREVLEGSFNLSTAGNNMIANPGMAITGLLIATAMLIVSMLAVPKIVSNIISTSIGSSSTASKGMTIMNMVNNVGGGSGGAIAGASSAGAAIASGGTTMAAAAATQAVSSAADNTGNAAQAPQRPQS